MFLMLRALNTVTPNLKLFPLLLDDCNFVIVMNRNVNIFEDRLRTAALQDQK